MNGKLISSEEEMLLELVESDGVGLIDELLDNVQPNVNTQSLETVDALLSNLGEEEFEVVNKYFGLSGDTPLSADEIGDLMGLDSDQITNIIGSALRQLRSSEQASERKVA
jgi:DNA-directed RNA polymerase sigma subunit (sigma70/sigma32)